MPDYTYSDFLSTLNPAAKPLADTIQSHIAQHHPTYAPHGIAPKDKTREDWSLYFRKHPKHGKPLCCLFSTKGALTVRMALTYPMIHELLLRQDEFGDYIRAKILLFCRCTGCRGDEYCWCQRYYLIKDELKWTCNTAWLILDNSDIDSLPQHALADFLRLIDLQSKHMTQNPMDSRGSGFEDEAVRCGEVEISHMMRLDFCEGAPERELFADTKKLTKYSRDYNLTWLGITHDTRLGADDGLWMYHDEQVICGEEKAMMIPYIPKDKYAVITVADPFSLSLVRAWDHVCTWARRNGVKLAATSICCTKMPLLVRFYKQDDIQYMQMYAQIGE